MFIVLSILNVLQSTARIRNIELAEKAHLSPPATHARVKRLEEDGIIKNHAAHLDRNKAGHYFGESSIASST